MAIIDPPASFPMSGLKVRLREPNQVNRSGWTSRRKVVGLPGAPMWLLSGEFSKITDPVKARLWRGFFVALRGQRNRFRLTAVTGRQTEAANPLVASAGRGSGITIPLQGLPVSQTVLGTGMMMTVRLPSGHERLVCLTADLVSDGAGNGTATFGPDLGEVPDAGSEVEIGEPWALVALANDTNGWDHMERIKHGFALETEEAL